MTLSRSEKINQAAQNVIITGNKPLSGIVRDDKVFHWSLKRLDNQTAKLFQYNVTTLVYQSSCKCWNEANGEQRCFGNNQYTVCSHVLIAFKESMRLGGFITCEVNDPHRAKTLLNLGCSFVKIINNVGVGFAITLAIKRDNTDERQAFKNAKQLLNSKRIGLTRPGQTMPIAYKVQLWRRRDDSLCFKSGYIISKPIIRYGRDYDNYNTSGKWKLTLDAERNWEEFISKILPGQTLADGSYQTDQERQRANMKEYYRIAGC